MAASSPAYLGVGIRSVGEAARRPGVSASRVSSISSAPVTAVLSAVFALAAAPRHAPAQVLRAGDIVVVDDQTDALYRVDPVTGDRSILSQAGTRGTGVAFGDPFGIGRSPGGNILVADFSVHPIGDTFRGGVIEVNPFSGDRTLVSGRDRGAGTAFDVPFDVIAAGGAIYVADAGFRNSPSGAVFRVDPATGDRALLPGLENPLALAPGGGSLIVTDGRSDSLFEVDLSGGQATLLSGPTRGTGESIPQPLDVAAAPDGTLFVVDTFRRAVFRVDAATGDRVIVSGAQTGDGPPFNPIGYVTVGLSGDLFVSGLPPRPCGASTPYRATGKSCPAPPAGSARPSARREACWSCPSPASPSCCCPARCSCPGRVRGSVRAGEVSAGRSEVRNLVADEP